jgi:hypothetical protein
MDDVGHLSPMGTLSGSPLGFGCSPAVAKTSDRSHAFTNPATVGQPFCRDWDPSPAAPNAGKVTGMAKGKRAKPKRTKPPPVLVPL